MGNCYITSTASFQISCGDDQSHNYNKCVIAQKLRNLTVGQCCF